MLETCAGDNESVFNGPLENILHNRMSTLYTGTWQRILHAMLFNCRYLEYYYYIWRYNSGIVEVYRGRNSRGLGSYAPHQTWEWLYLVTPTWLGPKPTWSRL